MGFILAQVPKTMIIFSPVSDGIKHFKNAINYEL